MTVRKTKPEMSRTSSFSGCMKICIAGIMFSTFYAISELRESGSAVLSVVKLDEVSKSGNPGPGSVPKTRAQIRIFLITSLLRH
jgi:hypothetical protein